MCSDFNNCNTNEGKPSEIQSCTPTLASNLGITKIAEDIGGEIQDFVNKSGSIKSTHIALILLFVLIILCSLFIYLRGPFRKKKLDNKSKIQTTQTTQAPQATFQATVQAKPQAPIYYREIKPELRIIIGAVIKAKSDGFSKSQIENELRSKGWKEEQIKEILSYILNNLYLNNNMKKYEK